MPKAQLIALTKKELADTHKRLAQLDEEYRKDRTELLEEIAWLTRNVNYMTGNPHGEVSIHEYEPTEKKKYNYTPKVGDEPKEGTKKKTILDAIRAHGPISTKDLSMLLEYPHNALSGQVVMLK